MLLQPVSQAESEAFDGFVGEHLHGDPLQGTCFGDLQACGGRSVHRFYLVEQGRPIGSLSLIGMQVGRLGTLLYAPRGPVLDPRQRVAWRALAAELGQAFPKAFAFSCAPRLEHTLPHPPGYWERAGLALSPPVPRTVVELPLSGDPARDFERLSRRCRVKVRRAKSHGVTVREAGPDELRLFLGLMRQGPAGGWSIAQTPSDLADVVSAFAQRGQAGLFLAGEDGAVTAASIVIRLGRHALCKHFGGDGGGRNRAAGYAAQWAAIAWAERQGAERCDITGFRASDDRSLQELVRRFGGIERRYSLLEFPLRIGPYLGYRLLPSGRLRARTGATAAAAAR